MDGETLANVIVGTTLLATLVISAVWYVLRVIGYWKVFTKAGEAGWKSIIPFYNVFVQYALTWKVGMAWIVIVLEILSTALIMYGSGALLMLGYVLAVVSVVFYIIGLSKLSKSFGHGGGFTFGLLIFEPLFTIILGFGKSVYVGNTCQKQ